MTVQITVRLPDELVDFIDAQDGSRASVVERALRRQMRRAAAERDAEIYRRMREENDDPDDLHGLAEWAAALPRDHLD